MLQPFTILPSSSKGTRPTLERGAKAKAPAIVRYDNEEVYRLTKQIKLDLLKVEATVQVDLAELVEYLFSSFLLLLLLLLMLKIKITTYFVILSIES